MAPLPSDHEAETNPQNYISPSFNPINKSRLPIYAPASGNPIFSLDDRKPIYDPQKDRDAEIYEPPSKRRKFVSENVYSELNKSTASQVVAQPDRRRRNGRPITYSDTQIKQVSPFQNTIVTKYPKPKCKIDDRESFTQPVIQHKQVMTTEQQLNLSSSTFEKLAAFRYNPQACSQRVKSGTSLPEDIPENDDKDIYEASQGTIYFEAELNSNYFETTNDGGKYRKPLDVAKHAPEPTNATSFHATGDIETLICPSETTIFSTPCGRHAEIDKITEHDTCPIFNQRSSTVQNYNPTEYVESYPDEYQTADNNCLKVLYSNDAFDDGIDDSDLLEISPWQESSNLLSGKNNNSNPGSNVLDSSSAPHEITQNNGYLLLTPRGSRGRSTSPRCSPSDKRLSDVDNMYCIDEDEENELLRLGQPAKCTKVSVVTESFIPPTSVEGPICVGSDETEVYDSALQFSPPKLPTHKLSLQAIPVINPLPSADQEDWSFIQPPLLTAQSSSPKTATCSPFRPLSIKCTPTNKYGYQNAASKNFLTPESQILDDRHEYEEIKPFARPAFPKLLLDRSPVVGLSAGLVLRVCFRIGEMYKEGARCNSLDTDAIIELFARVGFSSREPGTIKQHFQFLDLWHDRPPIATGILASYKTTPLADSESKVFIDGRTGKMARCLGRLKRDAKNPTRWILHIINIRETDWEEIRWTKRIVSGDCSTSHNED